MTDNNSNKPLIFDISTSKAKNKKKSRDVSKRQSKTIPTTQKKTKNKSNHYDTIEREKNLYTPNSLQAQVVETEAIKHHIDFNNYPLQAEFIQRVIKSRTPPKRKRILSKQFLATLRNEKVVKEVAKKPQNKKPKQFEKQESPLTPQSPSQTHSKDELPTQTQKHRYQYHITQTTIHNSPTQREKSIIMSPLTPIGEEDEKTNLLDSSTQYSPHPGSQTQLFKYTPSKDSSTQYSPIPLQDDSSQTEMLNDDEVIQHLESSHSVPNRIPRSPLFNNSSSLNNHPYPYSHIQRSPRRKETHNTPSEPQNDLATKKDNTTNSFTATFNFSHNRDVSTMHHIYMTSPEKLSPESSRTEGAANANAQSNFSEPQRSHFTTEKTTQKPIEPHKSPRIAKHGHVNEEGLVSLEPSHIEHKSSGKSSQKYQTPMLHKYSSMEAPINVSDEAIYDDDETYSPINHKKLNLTQQLQQNRGKTPKQVHTLEYNEQIALQKQSKRQPLGSTQSNSPLVEKSSKIKRDMASRHPKMKKLSKIRKENQKAKPNSKLKEKTSLDTKSTTPQQSKNNDQPTSTEKGSAYNPIKKSTSSPSKKNSITHTKGQKQTNKKSIKRVKVKKEVPIIHQTHNEKIEEKESNPKLSTTLYNPENFQESSTSIIIDSPITPSTPITSPKTSNGPIEQDIKEEVVTVKKETTIIEETTLTTDQHTHLNIDEPILDETSVQSPRLQNELPIIAVDTHLEQVETLVESTNEEESITQIKDHSNASIAQKKHQETNFKAEYVTSPNTLDINEKNLFFFEKLYKYGTPVKNTKKQTSFLDNLSSPAPKHSSLPEASQTDAEHHDIQSILGETIKSRYKVLELLNDEEGNSYWGMVMTCFDYQTGEEVIMKLISTNLAIDYEEPSILRLLGRHKSIPSLLDIFIWGDFQCIVTPARPQVCLQRVISSDTFKGVNVDVVRVISFQLLSLMKIFQSKSIIHGNVNPKNVYVRSASQTPGTPQSRAQRYAQLPEDELIVLLLNFEQSQIRKRNEQPYHPVSQVVHYRAPEVLLGLPYRFEADVWSVACLMLELLLGATIFSPTASPYGLLNSAMHLTQQHVPQEILQQSFKNMPHLKLVKKHPLNPSEFIIGQPFKKTGSTSPLYRLVMALQNEPNRRGVPQTYLDLYNLLSGMLHMDMSKRLKPADALASPFFKV